MLGRVERLLAWRYLRSRRREGVVSVIAGFSLTGIALGVATLIVVMAVMNGFRHELLSRILGINGHIAIYAENGQGIGEFDELAATLAGLPDVTAVTPLVEGQVMVLAHDQSSGAQVKGMRPEDIGGKALLAGHIRRGDLGALAEDEDAILMGDRLARRLGLAIGDRVTLIAPEGRQTVIGMMPRMKSYTLAATFEVGMYEYDASTLFMPLASAQRYFRLPEKVSALEITAASPDRAPALARSIQQRLSSAYRVYDWQRSNAQFFNAIQVERNVMFLILTLIILIAAFNIISGLVMLVKDKRGDIAILRSMGMESGGILRVFFLCGAAIGVIGTIAGVVLGLSFALNIETIRHWLESLAGVDLFAAEIYFLSQLPAIVDPAEVLSVVAMALALSFLATLYPAWRAARLNPVEALRDE